LAGHLKQDSPHLFRGTRRALTRLRSARGSSLIEAALVFPILILIIIGTVEIGLAFKDYLAVSAMSREGARIAALAGQDLEADCAVLEGIASITTQSDLIRIANVQIYKAAEGTGAQGATDRWVYNGGDPMECDGATPNGVPDGWTLQAAGWPPGGGRQITVPTQPGSPPLDIVGVRVQLNRSWFTGFPPFRGSFTIDESTITRMEPGAFEQP
jgi:hypothetical protein